MDREPVRDKVTQWKSGQLVRRMSLYLPPELTLKFKSRCAGLDMKYSEGVAVAIARWLGEDPADHLQQ